MKRLFHLSIVCGIVFGTMSCKKYLDKKENNSLIVPTSIADLQALLDYTADMNIVTPSYGEESADDYFVLQNIYDGTSDRDKLLYVWQQNKTRFFSDYSLSYHAIYYANLVMDQIKKNPVTPQNIGQWNNVQGSALFFRSYYSLQLAWLYAKSYDEATAGEDLGIILRLTSDINTPSGRSTVRETYERIIADARASIDLLPDRPLVTTRPSKCAAYGLLARTFLSMRQYDSAYKYANLSLSINSELIDFNNSAEVNITANIPFQRFNKETVFYTLMNTELELIKPSKALADTLLYSSYHDDDLRKQAFFRPNGSYRRFKGSYAGSSFLFTGITTAEMLLIRSECSARNGDTNAALDDLNALMSRRWNNTVPYPPITAADANEALSKILEERRKELLFRGLRWIDIKRLNKEGANIVPTRVINGQTYSLAPNENKYALPLPSDIVEIAGVPQNPGW